MVEAASDTAAWDAVPTPPAGAAPVLQVEGFEGPLDFLVEMVRRHRVDLGRLSILALVDQFVSALEASTGQVPLEQRGNWVVLASQLVLLKSQLLAPASPAEAKEAENAALQQIARLAELAAMRAAAAWLSGRPQLGQEVHARGRRELSAGPRAERVLAFLEATLVMLEGRFIDSATAPLPYRPEPLDLFRVPEALLRMRHILATRPDGGPMEIFLPSIPGRRPGARLQYRAALASTFVAGLELARDGEASIEQAVAFGGIRISRIDARN